MSAFHTFLGPWPMHKVLSKHVWRCHITCLSVISIESFLFIKGGQTPTDMFKNPINMFRHLLCTLNMYQKCLDSFRICNTMVPWFRSYLYPYDQNQHFSRTNASHYRIEPEVSECKRIEINNFLEIHADISCYIRSCQLFRVTQFTV